MGKLVVVEGCELDISVEGGPDNPGVNGLVPELITTLASADVKIGGKGVYSGSVMVKVALGYVPPDFIPVTPDPILGTVDVVLESTGAVLINGKSVLLEGDKGTAPWTGISAAASSAPVPCGGVVVVEVKSAGQISVLAS